MKINPINTTMASFLSCRNSTKLSIAHHHFGQIDGSGRAPIARFDGTMFIEVILGNFAAFIASSMRHFWHFDT